MATEIEKIADLNYNTTITLGVIEQNDDLLEIFNEQIKMPFNILFRLSEEGRLNDKTKELLNTIFEKIILTKKDLIDKYLRLADSSGIVVGKPNIISKVIEDKEEDIITIEEPIVIESKPKKQKNGKELPRRYGKKNIQKDIQKQNGNATPVQRAMLKVNDLKNIYVNLSARGIKDMLGGTNLLSDEDCRKIISVITIAERQLEEILKKKK